MLVRDLPFVTVNCHRRPVFAVMHKIAVKVAMR
jgi:hypothetical protein